MNAHAITLLTSERASHDHSDVAYSKMLVFKKEAFCLKQTKAKME